MIFSGRILDSEPICDGWSPINVNPSSELTVLDCMDLTFFELANQLGGDGGLAAINFSTMPQGLGLASACIALAPCWEVSIVSLHHAGTPCPATWFLPLKWWTLSAAWNP